MNRTWVRARLAEFHELTVQATIQAKLGGGVASLADLNRRADTLRKIFERLGLPSDVDIYGEYSLDNLLNKIDVAIGIVDDLEEVAEYLGRDVPVLSSEAMHPWVWDAARTFWDSRHYRAAVEAAAKAINPHTQTKVERRDISDSDLMNQILSEKRRPGQRYLVIPGDPNDLTVKSRNQALRPFAQGCFAGIRNLAAHEHGDDWPEQQALECLAALSIVARWIDECVVHEESPQSDNSLANTSSLPPR